MRPIARATALAHLFRGLDPDLLTSLFLRDRMDRVDVDAIGRIEDDLTRPVVEYLRL